MNQHLRSGEDLCCSLWGKNRFIWRMHLKKNNQELQCWEEEPKHQRVSIDIQYFCKKSVSPHLPLFIRRGDNQLAPPTKEAQWIQVSEEEILPAKTENNPATRNLCVLATSLPLERESPSGGETPTKCSSSTGKLLKESGVKELGQTVADEPKTVEEKLRNCRADRKPQGETHN